MWGVFSKFFRKGLKMECDPQPDPPVEEAGELELRAFKLASANCFLMERGKGDMHPSEDIWKKRKRVQNQKVMVV